MRSPQRRRQSAKNNASCSTDYQPLEQRVVLTTFFVDTPIDDASGNTDGLISFREALIAANTNAAFGDAPAGEADGDAIRFTSAMQDTTIPTDNGQYTITDDVLIQGGSSNVTFDGGGNDRIFLESTDEQVAFSRLNFQNGLAGKGGAISSVADGTTLVVDSNFTNNDANGLGGGAIYHEVGNLFVTNSTFDSNIASGASASGGGILSASGVTALRDTTLTSNVAMDAGGAIEIIDGSFFITDSTIGTAEAGNVAGPEPDGGNPGNGGGIHIRTGGATTLLNGTTVEGNVAANDGGGVWNAAGANLFVRNSSMISGNTASGNGGGGIYNDAGQVYMTNSTIADNLADGDSGSGGGIFSTDSVINVADSTISGNSAVRAGGGLELVTGFTRLSNVDLSGNDAGVNLPAAPGNGGGLHVTADAALVISDGTTVTNNMAASEGGGLWNQAGATMYIRSNTQITGNTAMGDNADNGGGGVFNNGGNVYADSATISGNSANGDSGSGGGIFSTAGAVVLTNSSVAGNTAARAGGGVELIDGYFGMTDSSLNNNDAGVTLTAAPGNGGGMHVTGDASSVFNNTEVDANVAAREGGGLWNQTGADMYLRNGTSITNNDSGSSAFSMGGGVYNKGYLSAMDSAFTTNSSAGNGGGLLNFETANAEIVNTDFTNNSTQARGGGIYNENLLSVTDSAFSTNVAAINGGGIFTEDGATTNLDNATFTANLPNGQN